MSRGEEKIGIRWIIGDTIFFGIFPLLGCLLVIYGIIVEGWFR